MVADRTRTGLENADVKDPRDLEAKLRGFIEGVQYQATTIRQNFLDLDEFEDRDILSPADRIIRRCKPAVELVGRISAEMTRLRREIATMMIQGGSHPGISDAEAQQILDGARRTWYCEVARSGRVGAISCSATDRYHQGGWNCRWVWEVLVTAAEP